MFKIANPSGSDEAGGKNSKLPNSAAATRYVNTIIRVTQGQNLGKRDSQELSTLGAACDLISDGKVAQAGDLLIQRFKSVESAVRNQEWETGKQQELIQDHHLGMSSLQEREVAQKMVVRKATLAQSLSSNKSRKSGATGGSRE